MSSDQDLPDDWLLETEQTVHDEFMGRDFTTVLYRQENTRDAIYINEIIGGENIWKFHVHHSGRDGDLGTADDVETAKEMAVAYMNEIVASG